MRENYDFTDNKNSIPIPIQQSSNESQSIWMGGRLSGITTIYCSFLAFPAPMSVGWALAISPPNRYICKLLTIPYSTVGRAKPKQWTLHLPNEFFSTVCARFKNCHEPDVTNLTERVANTHRLRHGLLYVILFYPHACAPKRRDPESSLRFWRRYLPEIKGRVACIVLEFMASTNEG